MAELGRDAAELSDEQVNSIIRGVRETCASGVGVRGSTDEQLEGTLVEQAEESAPTDVPRDYRERALEIIRKLPPQGFEPRCNTRRAVRRRVYFDAVIDLMARLDREIRRCGKARAYLAACVVIGADLEAALVAYARVNRHQVYRLRRRLSRPWSLGELIELAEQLGWLSGDELRAAKRIKDWRNRIHADLYASRPKVPVISKRTYQRRLKDPDTVSDALLEKL